MLGERSIDPARQFGERCGRVGSDVDADHATAAIAEDREVADGLGLDEGVEISSQSRNRERLCLTRALARARTRSSARALPELESRDATRTAFLELARRMEVARTKVEGRRNRPALPDHLAKGLESLTGCGGVLEEGVDDKSVGCFETFEKRLQ